MQTEAASPVQEEGQRRRVQVSGKSSCVVALPKQWAKEAGLRQGSEVTVTRLSRAFLLVNATPGGMLPAGPEVSIEVDMAEGSRSVFRRVASLYVLGYGRITVIITGGRPSETQRMALKSLIRDRMVGAEAIAESANRISIEVLLNHQGLTIEAVLKKMFQAVESIRDDTTHRFLGDRPLSDGPPSNSGEEVERFALYALRILNLSFDFRVSSDFRLENHGAFGYFSVTKTLQRVARLVSNLPFASELSRAKKPTIVKLASFESAAWALVDQAMLSLFKGDSDAAGEVFENCERFKSVKGTGSNATRTSPRTRHLLDAALNHSLQLAECASELARAVMDLTAEGMVRVEVRSGRETPDALVR